MRELIREGLNILMSLLSLVLYAGLMGCWVFYPEAFAKIPTNDNNRLYAR